MSRADSDSSYPMSYPVDAKELYFALHRLIAHKRATRKYGQNANSRHNGISIEDPHNGARFRRDIEDAQIDIPEVKSIPVMEYCKQIILDYGYLLPMLSFLGLYFFLAWIDLKK